MASISRKRSGYMHIDRWTALGVAAALTAVGATACTDPTVAPTSTVTGANFYNDLGSYQAFLAKVYAGLAVGGQNGGDGSTDIQGIDGGFSQYMRLYWELEELPTDEAVIAWGDQTLPELNTQGWNASNTFVTAMYYRVYFQIGMTNEFLRQTTDAVLAARGVTAQLKATIHTYRAEARFLRALSYWHGLDFFGDIPLLKENDPLGTVPTQSTRAAVYNYVVSELTAIRDSLPPPGPSSYGRATGPAADMLLAELYLNAGVYTGTPNYGGALNEASAVIGAGYALAPSYFLNFEADNNTSPEMVFAIPEDGIHRIADAFIAGEDVPNFVKVINTEEAAKNDFNLSPSRYVGAATDETYREIPEIVAELRQHEQKAAEVGKELDRVLQQLNVATRAKL